MMNPQAERVRSQIEEVKSYLSDSGFDDVAEAPVQSQSFEFDLHTILMTWQRTRRILRLSYGWMSDNGDAHRVRSWLEGQAIAERLRQHREVTIHDLGTIETA